MADGSPSVPSEGTSVSGKPRPQRPWRILKANPSSCIWAFHDNLLAVPERGRQIKVWDLEKGTFVQEMNDLGRKIQDLAFLADGKRLVSSSEGTMTLWTLETESEICSIPVPSYINGQWPKIVEVLEKLKRPPQQ